jgi:hypothetical protein
MRCTAVAVDLFQRVGLNKYEAEAYVALLADGPLTGYELGKRSNVPLSKSYETLEKLTRRGLALVQPGDPPRYLAERPDRILAQSRADHEAVLTALEAALADVRRADPADDFWVIRGRANVLTGALALIAEATDEVGIGQTAGDDLADLAGALAAARARGCRVSVRPLEPPRDRSERPDLLLVLADGHQALVGTLSPIASCQAVVSANPALVSAIRGAWTDREAWRDRSAVRLAEPVAPANERGLDWLAWEDRKHERLRRAGQGGRVA